MNGTPVSIACINVCEIDKLGRSGAFLFLAILPGITCSID